jgi:hypothetical protein
MKIVLEGKDPKNIKIQGCPEHLHIQSIKLNIGVDAPASLEINTVDMTGTKEDPLDFKDVKLACETMRIEIDAEDFDVVEEDED